MQHGHDHDDRWFHYGGKTTRRHGYFVDGSDDEDLLPEEPTAAPEPTP